MKDRAHTKMALSTYRATTTDHNYRLLPIRLFYDVYIDVLAYCYVLDKRVTTTGVFVICAMTRSDRIYRIMYTHVRGRPDEKRIIFSSTFAPVHNGRVIRAYAFHFGRVIPGENKKRNFYIYIYR